MPTFSQANFCVLCSMKEIKTEHEISLANISRSRDFHGVAYVTAILHNPMKFFKNLFISRPEIPRRFSAGDPEE